MLMVMLMLTLVLLSVFKFSYLRVNEKTKLKEIFKNNF